MTLDWVVLTAALVGTGLAVLGQIEGGVSNTTHDTAGALRGQVIQSSFSGELCSGGIAALQAKEDTRVATASDPSIDVSLWIDTYSSGQGDDVIRAEYNRLKEELDGRSGWSRDHTIMTALECELVHRGLD